jgi:hypothetical protein
MEQSILILGPSLPAFLGGTGRCVPSKNDNYFIEWYNYICALWVLTKSGQAKIKVSTTEIVPHNSDNALSISIMASWESRLLF